MLGQVIPCFGDIYTFCFREKPNEKREKKRVKEKG